MESTSGWQITVTPGGERTLERFGLDLTQVFKEPRLKVWRDLPERQNAYLDLPARTEAATPAPPAPPAPPAQSARLHVKRYKAPYGPDAAAEARAIGLLAEHDIPTVPLVAWGICTDGRGFLISSDLTGMLPADRAIREGLPTARAAALPRIAALAAKLHRSGLHHRDLYLCHFFINACDPACDVHLIDPGRVARLPGFPLNLRWIIKDLAQLCYSLREIGIADQQQDLLDRYFAEAAVPCPGLIRRLVPLKIASIARHDRKLRSRQPTRNISITDG